MTNILVPTDFSSQSLEVLDQVARVQQQPARLYLLHLVHMPTDISELVFLKKHRLHRLIPKDFYQQAHAYKMKYTKQFEHLELVLHYGSHSAIFNGIADNLRIDEIYVLDDYEYTLPLRGSVNLTKLINRSGLPVYRVESRKKIRGSAAFFRAEAMSTLT